MRTPMHNVLIYSLTFCFYFQYLFNTDIQIHKFTSTGLERRRGMLQRPHVREMEKRNTRKSKRAFLARVPICWSRVHTHSTRRWIQYCLKLYTLHKAEWFLHVHLCDYRYRYISSRWRVSWYIRLGPKRETEEDTAVLRLRNKRVKEREAQHRSGQAKVGLLFLNLTLCVLFGILVLLSRGYEKRRKRKDAPRARRRWRRQQQSGSSKKSKKARVSKRTDV